MKKFLNKNGKIMIICILALFGMNRCTVACNRAHNLEKNEQTFKYTEDSLSRAVARLNIDVRQRDSVIELLRTDTMYLNRAVKEAGLTREALAKRPTVVHNHYITKDNKQ